MINANVQTLKVNEKMFFVVWLRLLQAFLKLGKQEQRVLAKLLYYRYKFSQETTNKTTVDFLTLCTETRKKIKKELNLDTTAFNNTLSTLRKKKIIINNKINNKLIPVVKPNFTNFKLVYNIEVNEDIQK
jgi:hypothetical protein